jgi:pimeloyl-ACP methyl ester carboxylesterase
MIDVAQAIVFCGLWSFCALSPASAQGLVQLATFHSAVDDSDQSYALYTPKSMEPGRKYPLIIALHSEESNFRVALRRTLGMPVRFGEMETADMRNFPPTPDVPFLIACPHARGAMGYRGIPERDVYDVLADVERRYSVDPDRVYLTGASMGGAGALRLALTHPDAWAAVAVLCPTGVSDLERLAINALNLPIRLYQGELDPLVSPNITRGWQRRLLDAGAPVEYIEYPAVRHNAWDFAYRNREVLDWFAKQRRSARPARVRFTTEAYRYSSAYWTRIDSLTPGSPAMFDGRLSAGGLDVTTLNLDGFTISVPTPATVTIDGKPLRVRPGASTSFMKTAAGWRVGRVPSPGKHPGAEGPIAEAVAGRHIYVYGSGAAGMAERAAAWDNLKLPVKADTAVTAADLDSSDVVLFGTAETNRVIAQLAPRLPIALHAGAADYGLVFVVPTGSHYALINSGLPWWTGADEARRGGDTFLPEQYRLLTTFGDFILFKGSLANVIAEGRFDRNWKAPPEAAARMLATGTITINNQ